MNVFWRSSVAPFVPIRTISSSFRLVTALQRSSFPQLLSSLRTCGISLCTFTANTSPYTPKTCAKSSPILTTQSLSFHLRNRDSIPNHSNPVSSSPLVAIRNFTSVSVPSSTIPQATTVNAENTKEDKFIDVYKAPLKGAVRAIKIFSLTTATCAFFGGPALIYLGNPNVPLSGRAIMTSLVMFVGIGTTALLHWLVKGYVMKMQYNARTQMIVVNTLNLFAMSKKHEFHISEAGPPSRATAFSTFQAKGRSFFMHTEVFEDRKLLSDLLGAYSIFEMQGELKKDIGTDQGM